MTRPQSLKLLLLYDCVYPESLGGVEHRNHEVARALGERGHRVTVAGFTTQPRRTGPTTEVVSLGRPGRLYNSSGRRSLREAFRLALGTARLDLRQFDVVETANIPYLHIFPLALRCRLAGKPMLVTWYEHWGTYWKQYIGPVRWIPFAAIEWLAAQVGTATMAVSQLTAQRLKAHRRRADTQVLAIGIPVDTIRSAANDAPASSPLVYAGRLQKEKRIDLLLEAVHRLPSKFEKPVLTVIGDGPDKARLKQLARKLKLAESVVFSGRLATNQDVWRLMAGSKVAVQPSSREGYGLFPLEAMALGLPVIHCKSMESAVCELVGDERHGLSTEAEPAALATAIERLLTDENERRRLGDQARQRAEQFDWPEVARRLESSLFELLGRAAEPDSAVEGPS